MPTFFVAFVIAAVLSGGGEESDVATISGLEVRSRSKS
jgi:hypothetical protein